jgi:hypothetical protein
MVDLLIQTVVAILVAGAVALIVRLVGPLFKVPPEWIDTLIKVIGIILVVWLIILWLGLLRGPPLRLGWLDHALAAALAS